MTALLLSLLLAAPAFADDEAAPAEAPATEGDSAATEGDPTEEAAAPEPEPAPEPALEDPVVWDQDAGTRVVLVEDHRAPLVAVRIQLPAGTRTPWFHDNGGEEAFVDMFYDSEGSLRARADELGADFSFATRDERSIVSVFCLKRDLPEVMGLLGEVLSNTDYDPGELSRDQKNRKIGWKSGLKDPNFMLRKAVAEKLYAEGDARRIDVTEPLDVVQDVEALVSVRDTLLTLPGRVIGFGGDLTREEAEALAGGVLPPVATELPEGLEPVFHELPERPDVHIETMPNLTQVYFSWFRDGLTWDDPDYVKWRIANHALGGHFYSRLYKALRHEGGETYGARSAFIDGYEPEAYALGTFTRTDNKATTEEKLRKVMDELRANGLTQDELDAAVGAMRGELLFDRQAPAQVLDTVLLELAYDKELGFEAKVVEAAEKLSLEEVNAFIAEYYDPAKFTMLTVEPEG